MTKLPGFLGNPEVEIGSCRKTLWVKRGLKVLSGPELEE